jgi:Zn-dependent M28 family amino/carboxypeptidase
MPTPALPPKRARRFRLAAPQYLAAMTLAACGGGTDDEVGPTEQPHAISAATCLSRPNDNFNKLLECVTLGGVRAHQQALQTIANSNGGTRATGTPGYDESLAYVEGKLAAAGYNVTRNAFPFLFSKQAELQQVSPGTATYLTGTFTGSGIGNVTAPVQAVDIQLGLGNTSSSGCEAADFTGFPAGSIALVQRGTCPFADKALNAQAAGATAVIVFNQGNTTAPDRNALIVGTLAPATLAIPVVGASYADGVAISQTPAITMRVATFAPVNTIQYNLLAETRDGNAGNVVMVGAHLDSVQAGPGINDNGSGSAAILEVALQMAKVKPRNKVRFAWWGAEESGLVGSTAYVNGLSQADKDRIALYLNFDMVGSPNHVFFIYDGDDSDADGAPAGPPGSKQIEDTFERFFDLRNVPYKGTDFSGRSDYGAFIANGIPAGGLFTGAEGLKSAEEASIWGGTAGQQYDPCYHLACDTFANNSNAALDTNSDAIAYATLQYAMSTADVNGAKGKGNFKVVVPYPPAPSQ